jgi:hypothetical protein
MSELELVHIRPHELQRRDQDIWRQRQRLARESGTAHIHVKACSTGTAEVYLVEPTS